MASKENLSNAEKINQFRNQRKQLQSRNLKVLKRQENIVQAFDLPVIMNINPRSAMNKLDQLKTFIEEQNVDCAFVSESHDRKNFKLEDNFELENVKVI